MFLEPDADDAAVDHMMARLGNESWLAFVGIATGKSLPETPKIPLKTPVCVVAAGGDTIIPVKLQKQLAERFVIPDTAWFNGRTGSEASFIPKENAKSEDDGYLMSFVHDAEEDKSELVILNMQEIEDDPICRIHLPVRVPAGFHGSWIAD